MERFSDSLSLLAYLNEVCTSVCENKNKFIFKGDVSYLIEKLIQNGMDFVQNQVSDSISESIIHAENFEIFCRDMTSTQEILMDFATLLSHELRMDYEFDSKDPKVSTLDGKLKLSYLESSDKLVFTVATTTQSFEYFIDSISEVRFIIEGLKF